MGLKIVGWTLIIIGGADPRDGDTKWFPDRAAAGYPPYPALKN